MTTLTVGVGKQFSRISDAVTASSNGDTILVDAGTYTNDFSTITKQISIIGVGGMAKLEATVPIPNGKAILITQSDVTLENLEFTGANVADGNGAGIRFEGGTLTVRNSYFHDNENGILGASVPNGRVIIENSEFARNGVSGVGQTHGIYLNVIAELTVTGSYFHDSLTGHLIKSRALKTVIEGNVLDGGITDTSYEIDLPNGGVATIRDNAIVQGANPFVNRTIISYSAEATPHPGSSLLVENNIIANYRVAGGDAVRNWSTIPVQLTNNDFYNVTNVLVGPGTETGSTALTQAPLVTAASPWATTPVSLAGTSGSDGLLGGAGGDTLSGLAGNDLLIGGGGNDVLDGGNGDDTLDGGAGADTMRGGQGNDQYIVDNWQDHAMEGIGEGVDTLIATIDYQLEANAENLTFAGTRGFLGVGNELANVITGGPGNDALYGWGGDDTFNGGAGADWMRGWQGNDTYYIDNWQDHAEEGLGEGTDTLVTTINYQLEANADNLTYAGTGAFLGVGNELANTITGGPGNDALYGWGGNDTLNGGAGADWMRGWQDNDTYYIDNWQDHAEEGLGEGIDTLVTTIDYELESNAENLTYAGTSNWLGVGNELGNAILGGAGNDQLYGWGGADTLNGGAGADRLHGWQGNDDFVFRAGQANGDTVADFDGGGALAADELIFQGYGVGATFIQTSSTTWRINYALGSEVITFTNAAPIHPTDYTFTVI